MDTQRPDKIELRVDRFAARALSEEAQRLGTSVEELATFAVLYYLADLDSGRIARRIPPGSRTRRQGRPNETGSAPNARRPLGLDRIWPR